MAVSLIGNGLELSKWERNETPNEHEIIHFLALFIAALVY